MSGAVFEHPIQRRGYYSSYVRKDHVMATPLTLNTDRGVDGTPRVTAAGEIDISNIHVFTEALTTASEGSRRPITVDMSAVKYLDSAGINVLFKHADEIDRLHLIVHPFLMRVLTISGLSEIANVQPAPAPARQDSDGRDGASDGRL